MDRYKLAEVANWGFYVLTFVKSGCFCFCFVFKSVSFLCTLTKLSTVTAQDVKRVVFLNKFHYIKTIFLTTFSRLSV